MSRSTPRGARSAWLCGILFLLPTQAATQTTQRSEDANRVTDPQSAAAVAAQDSVTRATRLEMFGRYLRFGSYLGGGRVEPEWLPDGDRFTFTIAGDPNGRSWLVDPAANAIAEVDAAESASPDEESPGSAPQARILPGALFGVYPVREAPSPDGRWFAGLQKGNIVLRDAATDSILPLTDDGSEDRPWGDATFGWTVRWSPGSDRLFATRYAEPTKGFWPLVHYPAAEEAAQGARPTVDWWPGGFFGLNRPSLGLAVFDVPSGRRTDLRIEDWPGQEIARARWTPDGSWILMERLAPRGQAMELLAVDPADGSVRVLVSQEAPEGEYLYPPNEPLFWVFLEDGRRFIVRLERDGWQHLFLYDIQDGLIRQLTSGPFAVRDIEFIDEVQGWIYIKAHTDVDRPYDQHLARVPLAGGDVTVLTDAPGKHAVRFSPSGRFFIDTYSSSTQPYRSDLRAADGRLLRTLAAGTDSTVRKELAWTPPEEFTALASDGRTRLHGHLFKPWDFDPTERYPVIDYFNSVEGVGATVFRDDMVGQALHNIQALAQLGFIVVTFDTRGTFWRGTDFRNATFEKGGELEIADHVSVLRDLAATRPWMDMTRVGSFGFSMLGFFSARALLLAPDVYRVGVSAAGPDFLPGVNDYLWFYVSFEPGGDYRPNFRLADRLEGRLLLISGTEDFQGPLYTTMPLIDGLVRAGKPYDLRLIPGATHAMFWPGGPYSEYFWDTVADYFLDHLARSTAPEGR